MAKIQVRKASGWHTVADGTKVQVRKGGTWVTPTKIQARKGGTWVTVWNKSDPITLAFECNASQGWRESTAWRTDNKVRFGAFQTFGDNLTVLEFSGDSTTGGYTSTSLEEALAVRPNVTALKLTLTRGSGGSSTISGSTSETLLVGQLNKNNGTAMSTYDAGNFVQTTNMQTIPASDLQGWSYLSSQTKQFTFGGSDSTLTGLATHLSTKQMWISEKSTGWIASGGGTSSSDIYSVCNGSADSSGKPILTVTMDY